MDDLQISSLSKAYGGLPVLEDVGFTVAAGSLVAILGASGSGKTTLLRLIAGFDQPDAGDIRLGGASIIARPPQARGIGYVAQEGALFPHLTVADNITFGLPRAQRRARHRVAELLALCGLPASYADRAPQNLSGGEQQRVALARALAPNPRLILLDEPFSALDAALRADTRAAVAAALLQARATAILVTHDQEEAFSIGARVGVLRAGALAQMGAPATIYHHPADAALAGFIGDAVLTPGHAQGQQVICALGRLRLAPAAPNTAPLAGDVAVMIRPEQIKLSPHPTPDGIAAQVSRVTFFGHDAMLGLRLTGAAPAEVTARMFSQAVPATGSDVWLTVEGDVVAYQ